MFTGIIEGLGKVVKLERDQSNLHISLSCPFSPELKIDQSLAHNGVCLTVVNIDNDVYTVTAIDETLERSNLKHLKIGSEVNLERCTQIGARLDGHIVQGHVDQTGICKRVENLNGSWKFNFEYQPNQSNITVPKGSICINGVSLTVVDSEKNSFSVALIPYTYENTSFKFIKEGDEVNLEFDIIGKYIARLMDLKE
tara:strand:- start:140869 stop:141459 length:591 start_codon:yes stop_codon:yes gene_type:complete